MLEAIICLTIAFSCAAIFFYIINRKNRHITKKNELLFNLCPCAIAIHEKGSIVKANQEFCKLFGHRHQEIEDFHLLELICHEFRNLAFENFKTRCSKTYFVLAKRKNGERIHLEFTDEPYGAKHIISFIKDITHSKEVEKENNDLRQQSVQNEKLASMGSLISSVIHELNAPLTAIASYSEILNDSTLSKNKNIPRKLLNASKKMKIITEQLRQVSRSSKYDTLRPVNIKEAIQVAIDIFESQLREKEITISLNDNNINPQIWGNQNQIESIFQNLLANSRDAFDELDSNRKRYIKIVLSMSGNNNLHIEYQDNAGGMPIQIIQKLFTPFFTTKSKTKGTGLGMSITKSIVEKHNGVITASSVQDQGTTFNIVFPAIHSTKNKTKNIKFNTQKSPIITPSAKLKALIVDDQDDIIDVLSIYLEKYFFIDGTTDSFNALEKIKSTPFDLIITDLQMPHHSGLDIISAARIHQPQTPIIVVSGHSGKSEKANIALNKGANLILPKPFESKEGFVRTVLQLIHDKNKSQVQSPKPLQTFPSPLL